MKPENQINAGVILLLHSLLITIGMAVTYAIPTAEDRPASIGLSFDNLYSQRHSDEQLQSWLSFLELPHREMLVSKETLAEVLKKDKSLAHLDFFHNVAAGDRAEYLAQRLTATKNADVPYQWDLWLKGGSNEETNTILSALQPIYDKQLKELGSASTPPIKVNDSTIEEANERQFGKACSPAIGALLAVILVVVVWSSCGPDQRKLPFSSSIGQLLVASSLLALVGTGIGFLVGANTQKEFESEMVVQVRNSRFWMEGGRSPETRQLTEKLRKKIEVKNYLGQLKRKSVISALVTEHEMATWRSFKSVAHDQFSQNDNEGAADHDLLCDYILDRLEIEQDQQAPDIYTLRFRCEDKFDSASLLAGLINAFTERLDTASELAEFGSPLTNRYRVERLANPNPKKVTWFAIACGNAFEGALIGAIFSLVIFSSTRVLSGTSPI